MKIWIATGKTESYDEICRAFSSKPTDEQVDAQFYKDGWDEEYRYVGWTNWSLHSMDVVDPSSITPEDIAKMQEAVKKSEEE